LEGSIVAVRAVGKEVDTEKGVEIGQRDESRQEEGCSHHRLYHIADADEERGVERTG